MLRVDGSQALKQIHELSLLAFCSSELALFAVLAVSSSPMQGFSKRLERLSHALAKASLAIEKPSLVSEDLSLASEKLYQAFEKAARASEKLAIPFEKASHVSEMLAIVLENLKNGAKRRKLGLAPLSGKQNDAQVAHVCSRGTRGDGIVQGREERARVAASQKIFGFESEQI
jgi:hypothetical protein